MSFIFPLMFVVFGSGTMVMISKRRFEEVLPAFLMCSIIIVFLSGFLNQLLLGYLAAITLAAIFPISIIIRLFKRKDLSDLRKKLFTPGFCIFIILYVFIYILNFKRGFTLWDEISHWGPMVKETLRLDKFYSVAESALAVHRDYPPAVTLFESLWCKLSGGYNEAYLYTSLQILSLSLFFPALSSFNWDEKRNSITKIILLVIVMLSSNILIQVGEASFYKSIYIDCFLGLLFGYCLFLVVQEKHITKFGIVRLSVALAVLLLTKQMGLFFFFLILMAFAVNYLVTHRHKLKGIRITKREAISVAAVLICLLIIPMVFMFSWNTYISALDIHGSFNISDIKIFDFPGIISGSSGESYQHTAFVNYTKSILQDDLFDRPIGLSYWQLIILAAVVFFLLGKYGRRYYEKYQLGGLNIVICMGAIAYAFVMLLLYLFSFSPYEATKLASNERYFNTYWFAVFVLAAMLFLYINGKNEKERNKSKSAIRSLALAALVSWLILFKPAAIVNFIPSPNQSVTSEYQEDAGTIIDHTDKTDSIFIIAQHDKGYIKHILTYLTLPRSYNGRYFSLGEPYNEEDVWTADISEEQWLSELSGYDYLYLCEVDDQFIEGYSGAFRSKNQIQNKRLFQIIHQPRGTIDLSLVE